MKRFFKNSIAAVLTLLGIFCAAELAFGFYIERIADVQTLVTYGTSGQIMRRGGVEAFRWAGHPHLRHYPKPDYRFGKNRHNSLGYRGKEVPRAKRPGEFRILCLGGAGTYGAGWEDYRHAYPYQLERRLNEAGFEHVTVVNAGCEGWDSSDTLVNFQFRSLDLSPDLIIVQQGIEDMAERMIWPSSRLTPDLSLSSVRVADTGSGYISILKKSALARAVMIRLGRIRPEASIDRIRGWERPYSRFAEFDRQKRRGVYPEGLFKEVPAAAILASNKPRTLEASFSSLAAIASAFGVRTLFVQTPVDERGGPSAPGSEECVAALREQNEVVRAVAERTGSQIFDPGLSALSDPEYFDSDGGLSEKGAARLAAELTAYLRERIPSGRPNGPAGEAVR